MAPYLSGLRGRSAKPYFSGSNPLGASHTRKLKKESQLVITVHTGGKEKSPFIQSKFFLTQLIMVLLDVH
jgi:hypothetical protein